MLQKQVNGRLGNQMFQYAVMRSFMLENQEEGIRINFDRVKKEGFNNELINFQIYNLAKDEKIVMSKKQTIILKVINKIEFLWRKKYINNASKYNEKAHQLEKRISSFLMRNGIYFLQQVDLHL